MKHDFCENSIIIHNLEDIIKAAEKSLKEEKALTLTTAYGAVEYAGAAYFLKMLETGRARYPEANLSLILNCGRSPGTALGALREGAKALILDAPDVVFEKVASIADQQDARVLRPYP